MSSSGENFLIYFLLYSPVLFFAFYETLSTYCRTFSECRRTIPWAVALWILYPLARLEVYSEVPVSEYLLDNDLAISQLSRTFNGKFFKVIQAPRNSSVHPANYFPMSPCTYLVYTDPLYIPFGRDFLNSHMQALAEANYSLPIVYFEGDKLQVMVRRYPAPVRLIKLFEKESRQFDMFFECFDTLYSVESFAVYSLLLSYQVPLERYIMDNFVSQKALVSLLTMENFNSVLPLLRSGFPEPGAQSSPSLVMDMLFIPLRLPSPSQQANQLSENHCQRLRRHNSIDTNTCASRESCLENDSMLFSSAVPVPHFWLTSSAPRVSVAAALQCFSAEEVEAVVQHLDPILQNALLQKILAFVPPELRTVLRLFDATDYPNVISLLDARHQNWVKDC